MSKTAGQVSGSDSNRRIEAFCIQLKD